MNEFGPARAAAVPARISAALALLAAAAFAAPQDVVADGVCLLCHGDVRTAPAAAPEAGPGPSAHDGLVHSGVACVDCHVALRDFDTEAMEHAETLPPASCAVCHAEQQAELGASLHGDAGLTCARCHGSHEVRSVHAADAPVATGRVNASCGACHAAVLADGAAAVHALALSGRTCLACHDAHRPARPTALAADASCLSCHADDEPPGAAGHPADVAGSVHGAAGIACVLCHADLRDTEAFPHGASAPVRCGACHAGAAEAHGRGVHARHPDGERAAADCGDCHGAHDVQSVEDPRSRVFPLRLPDTCETCHQPASAGAPASGRGGDGYETSAHGLGLRRDGLIVTATCRSCHGSHEIRPVGDPDAPTARGRVPGTCGACHVGILQTYLAGVHGQRFLEGGTDVPVCTDCHGEHEIAGASEHGSSVGPERVSATCAKCHADDELATRYGLAAARWSSWGRSYHGIASALGEGGAANCASCHGFHEIFPSSDPRSSVHPANLEQTCGSCHAGLGAAFARVPVHSMLERETNFVPWVVREVYLVLIVLTIGFFLVLILIDLFGRLRVRMGWGPPETEHVDPSAWPDEAQLVAPDETFARMSFQARLQHGLLASSFVLLVLTGLPVFLSDLPFVRSVVELEGGWRMRSLLHRAGAIGLIGLSLWHLAGLALSPRARRWVGSILLRPRDLVHFGREVMFDLGLAAWLARRPRLAPFFERHPGLRFDRRPAAGRYGLVEKLEYTAVVWGNAVMIASGFVLWRPDWFLERLPTWVFEVARVTHGYEATLAFLAIIVWHMYHVHLRPGVFPGSRVWLRGTVGRDVLRRDHPAEYLAILARRRAAQGGAGAMGAAETAGAAGSAEPPALGPS